MTSDGESCGTTTCNTGELCDATNNTCLTNTECTLDQAWTTADAECYCPDTTGNATLCSTGATCTSTDNSCSDAKSVGNLKAEFVGKSGKVKFYDSTAEDGANSGFTVSWSKVQEKTTQDANNAVLTTGSMASSDFVYTVDGEQTNISTLLRAGNGNNAPEV